MFVRFFLICCPLSLAGQMASPEPLQPGYEWIIPDLTYYSFSIDQDGVYRISGSTLRKFGIPTDDINGSQYRLYRHGEEQPLFVSSNQRPFADQDYLLFFGSRLRDELDHQLLPPGQKGMNTEYSLFGDSTRYFLTWAPEPDHGKRFHQPDSTRLYDPATSVWTEMVEVFSEQAIQPHFLRYVQPSVFAQAEGFASQWRTDHQIEISLDGLVEAPTPIQFWVRYTNGETPTPGIIFRHQGEVVQATGQLAPWSVRTHQTTLNPIGKKLQVNVLTQKGKMALAWVKARYRIDPQSWICPDQGARLLTSFPVECPVLWRLPNKSLWLSLPQEDPFGLAQATWWATPESGIISISKLHPVQVPPLPDRESDYFLVGPADWFRPGSAGESYAQYRRSAAGGAYRVGCLSVETAAFYFGYGYSQHPLTWQRFAQWQQKSFNHPLLFILGKGLHYAAPTTPFPPTYGRPGSDFLLFHRPGTAPTFGIGRLAASTETDVRNYLTKVKTFEHHQRSARTTANHSWRKRVLHLTGGSGHERVRFSALLSQLAQQLSQNGYGANVLSPAFDAETTGASPLEQAMQAIESGVGIKTFLGHGSVVNTDIGLDDPAIFNPTEKWSLAFSLGCQTGNLFTSQESVSERFVLSPDRGSIAYAASSGVASDYDLYRYLSTWYDLLGGEFFDQNVGSIFREAYARLQPEADSVFQVLLHQMTYHGDPAIRLHPSSEADYAFDTDQIRLQPAFPATNDATITIQATIYNLGRNWTDGVPLRAHLTGPENLQLKRDTLLSGSFPLAFSIAIPLSGKTGRHSLQLLIDPEGQHSEGPLPQAKTNNHWSTSFTVVPNHIIPAYPPEGMIFSDTLPHLFAISTNGSATQTPFHFQIDTTPFFDSPLQQSYFANGMPLTVWKKPKLTYHNVWYWRAKSSSLTGIQNSPIQYFWWKSPPASPGIWQWNYRSDSTKVDGIQSVTTHPHKWQFSGTTVGILAMSVCRPKLSSDRSRLFLDNQHVDKVPDGGARFFIYTFPPNRPQEWERADFRISDQKGRQDCARYLAARPPGYSVLILAYTAPGETMLATEWPNDSAPNLFDYLLNQGALHLRRLPEVGQAPYILVYRQGGPILAESPISLNPGVRTSLTTQFAIRDTRATLISPWIGPARKWHTLSKSATRDGQPGQALRLTLRGKTRTGQIDSLRSFSLAEKETLLPLPSQWSLTYPYLQLTYHLEDLSKRVCPDPGLVQLHYEPYPAYFLHPLFPRADTLVEGHPITVKGTVFRLGSMPPDTTIIEVFRPNFSGSAFAKKDTLFWSPGLKQQPFQIHWPSPEWTGHIDIAVQLTALNQGFLEKDIPIHIPIFIRPDQDMPRISILHQGQSVAADQLVPTDAVFSILIKDAGIPETLADTNLIDIQLYYPNGEKRMVYPQLESIESSCIRLSCAPDLNQSGTYEWDIQARDKAGNRSRYQQRFQVDRTTSLTHLLPYPNPFHRQTRFWYTYTGQAPLTDFQLVIATISGRVVRTIDATTFGPLKIGRHLSDFAWDGTDHWGDPLANGVYLYWLQTNEGVTQRPHLIDPFFRKGIGKVVLLR